MNPVVSTVIPTHNRAALLPGAVRSVLAQTSASGAPIAQEVWITDDASTDDTPIVAQTLCAAHPSVVKYLRVQTGTPGGTRNAGAACATAPLLAFLDDDDEWLPGRLAKSFAVFAAHPDTAFVYGQTLPATAELLPLSGEVPPFPPLPLAEGCPVDAILTATPHLNATLFRRDCFESVGGFDAALNGFEDADLLMRVARQGATQNLHCRAVPEPLAIMRFHTDASNAGTLWKRFVSETTVRRRHLAVRDAHRPPFGRRVRMGFAYRGWYAHRFLIAAQASAQASRRTESLIALRRALQISPLHALKSPLLWQTLRGEQTA